MNYFENCLITKNLKFHLKKSNEWINKYPTSNKVLTGQIAIVDTVTSDLHDIQMFTKQFSAFRWIKSLSPQTVVSCNWVRRQTFRNFKGRETGLKIFWKFVSIRWRNLRFAFGKFNNIVFILAFELYTIICIRLFPHCDYKRLNTLFCSPTNDLQSWGCDPGWRPKTCQSLGTSQSYTALVLAICLPTWSGVDMWGLQSWNRRPAGLTISWEADWTTDSFVKLLVRSVSGGRPGEESDGRSLQAVAWLANSFQPCQCLITDKSPNKDLLLATSQTKARIWTNWSASSSKQHRVAVSSRTLLRLTISFCVCASECAGR